MGRLRSCGTARGADGREYPWGNQEPDPTRGASFNSPRAAVTHPKRRPCTRAVRPGTVCWYRARSHVAEEPLATIQRLFESVLLITVYEVKGS